MRWVLGHHFHGKRYIYIFFFSELNFYFGQLRFCSNFAESSFSCSCWPCLWLLRPVLKRKCGRDETWKDIMHSYAEAHSISGSLRRCTVAKWSVWPPAGHPAHSFAAWQCGHSYRALAESCPGRQGRRFERPRSADLVHLPPGADPERALRASLRSSRGNADPCLDKNNFS